MTTTSFSGADVDQLRAMASACADGAGQLVAISRRTTIALCTQLAWNGPDAEAMRARWQNEALPAMGAVASSLREAGLHLVREAQQQLAASTDGGSAGGPAVGTAATNPAATNPAAGSAGAGGGALTAAGSGAAAGGGSVDLAHELGRLRDKLTVLPAAATLGSILADLPAGGGTWADVSAALGRVDAAGGVVSNAGGAALGVYSAVKDADGLVTAIENRDVAGIIEHGIPLAFTAMGPEVDATLGTAWAAGTMVGDQIYQDMQGTRYGDIVQSMTDDAFEQHGAWGMLRVPGILGFAAYEYLTEDRPAGPVP